MSLIRRPTSWAALIRHRTTHVARSSKFRQSWQQVQRRTYASGGDHGSEKAKSDLPWLAGSIAVTVPSCWYLLQEGPAKPSHHEPGNDESHEDFEAARKGTEGADGEVDESKDEENADHDEGEKAGDSGESSDEGETAKSSSSDEDGEKSDDSPPSGTDGEKQGSPDPSGNKDPENTAHETEAGDDVEGVRGKGATKDGPAGDTRKHIPDAKGYNKKRIESDYGHSQSPDKSEESEPDKGDKAATAKAAGSQSTMSGKQEGVSNTDTKHSSDPISQPDTPKKPEGPETAKAKGTVDPQRSQV
ncbi:hypothetical protein MMC26_000821 [Xylographa opegraphella]|nr:hypothetical protein [Xylographa opegraphella]